MVEDREKALGFLKLMQEVIDNIEWYSVFDIAFDAEDDSKTVPLIGGGGKEVVDREPTVEKLVITILSKVGTLPVERDDHGFVRKRGVK